MRKSLLFMMSVVGLLWGCDTIRNEKLELQSRVDSLTIELESTQQAMQTLSEVGSLMDSIDASRNVLHTHMVEGTSYTDYVNRMNDIHDYVKETENKIRELEKSVRSSKGSSATYAKTIKNLKADLEKKNNELIALQEAVERFRNESQNLAETVTLQQGQIAERDEQIRIKVQELETINKRVDELLVQSKVDEADNFFKRAQAVEETAKRTKFAPRKKKETRMEALELYRMAVFLGKEEAQQKVIELEGKI